MGETPTAKNWSRTAGCQPQHGSKLTAITGWPTRGIDGLEGAGGPMRTEKEKMLAGELYDPLDPELVRARERARDLCQELNATRERDRDTRRSILKQLLGRGGESVWMQPPFFCDYGSNILLGERVFFNFNCVVL